MKKCISLLLAALLLFSSCCAGAETIKHERVFAVIGADGTPETILDNVRLENRDKLDVLMDETNLTGIENVSGMEEFTLSGQTLVWEAHGNDITYRGKGEKALPATPRVTYALDGQEIAAAQVAQVAGNLCLTVTYAQETAMPLLALTCIVVPEGVTEMTAEHGVLLSEAGKQFILGWAVPGAEEALGLPTAFTVYCHVDHAEFAQMLTIETVEPVKYLLNKNESVIADVDRLVGEATAILSSFQAEEPLPEGLDALKELAQPLAQLAEGVSALEEGADQLYEGAAFLESGVCTLNDGLNALRENNETLNTGAEQIFAGVLQTANEQLASIDLEKLGVLVPELTPENYASLLEETIAQLADTERLTVMLAQNAREQIACAVAERDLEIREAVTQKMQTRVLETILSQLEMPMTAEDYAAAVAAKQISEKQDAQIQAALALQMEDEAIVAELEGAISAQKEALIAGQMESPELQIQLAEALTAAQEGADGLALLKANLDGICAFVHGIAEYTNGVSQASDGLSQLMEGSASLKDGAFALKDGVNTLHTGMVDGEKALAEQYLPGLTGNVEEILRAIHAIEEALGVQLSYDAVPEDMEHDLCVIIRTEMRR